MPLRDGPVWRSHLERRIGTEQRYVTERADAHPQRGRAARRYRAAADAPSSDGFATTEVTPLPVVGIRGLAHRVVVSPGDQHQDQCATEDREKKKAPSRVTQKNDDRV
jgi:hypothetical protein